MSTQGGGGEGGALHTSCVGGLVGHRREGEGRTRLTQRGALPPRHPPHSRLSLGLPHFTPLRLGHPHAPHHPAPALRTASITPGRWPSPPLPTGPRCLPTFTWRCSAT